MAAGPALPRTTASFSLWAALVAGLVFLALTGCRGTAPANGTTAAGDSTGAEQALASPAPTSTIPPSPTPSPTALLPPTNTPPSVLPVAAGEEAPDFQFTLFQGEDVLGDSPLRLSDLEGKPLVLNFWARFCTPCWSEMPELQDFYEENHEDVTLVGVDIGRFTGLGSPKDASRLLDALGITYPAGSTDDGSVVRKYGVRAMPTTVFITSEGEVFQIWTGSISREEVTAIALEMLEEG